MPLIDFGLSVGDALVSEIGVGVIVWLVRDSCISALCHESSMSPRWAYLQPGFQNTRGAELSPAQPQVIPRLMGKISVVMST